MAVRTIAIVLGMLIILAGVSSYWLTRPIVDGDLNDTTFGALSIAPRGQAFTLARSRSGAVLLVTDADKEGIFAIDVSAATAREYDDVLQAYDHLGAAGLQAMYDAPVGVSLSWEQLGMAVARRYPHVAAGTNYRAHADEVGHEGEPFLFPKLSTPSGWDSAVMPGTRLDYEVELCAVALSEHTRAAPAPLGYLLCGDFTDRWLLVRDIDLEGEMGQTGFPMAKGGDSRLPTGPLLVIPLSDDFYRHVQLSLYVNGALRQNAGAEEMLWSPRQILSQTLDACDVSYYIESDVVAISHCERIPAGTLLLTGTPEGVLFHLGTLWNPWAYLRPGDVVTSFGTYLGFMQNAIRQE